MRTTRRSIAKITLEFDDGASPRWPTALIELADRVPLMCQSLMRAVLEEDIAAARSIVAEDKVIDRLDRQLFKEVDAWIRQDPTDTTKGMLAYRVGRELERVGDLMANIGEDIVYLVTGEIIRHQKPDEPPPVARPA